MPEADPGKLADALDEEVEAMHRRTQRVGDELAEIRKDWENKRADPNVPGAPAPAEGSEGASASEDSGEASASEEPESPGPEAPPPEAHPADAEAPSETAVGPPAED